jgi:hypothetical protein
MVELVAARVEIEATVVVDVVCAVAVELTALRGSSISNSVTADDGTDDKLKLVREATRD